MSNEKVEQSIKELQKLDETRKQEKSARLKQEWLAKQKKDRILSIALGQGIKAGCIGVIIFGGISLAATKYSPMFAKSMSISAKVSLPTMAALFGFGLVSERTMSSVQRDPHAWSVV